MSYLVLARKYRPRVFADMVGQEVVTATLRGAIAEQRVGHAYLFTGPRGTGKTTTARILAKALNCERGPTADPCGTCERCLAADAGNEIDIIEIDAASNTGVDYARELRDQAAYLPLRARFKIYIVDEAHMLSKAAFNALLKTLEEPPPHVKFFFATTELDKMLETIVSRCQVLRLLPISEAVISARLEQVFRAEKVEAEAGVAGELARRARGGMRDALSLADQLLSLAGESPRLADLARVSAASGGEAFEALFDALEAGDPVRALAALPATGGGEAEFLSALLDQLRATLLVGLCGENLPQLELSAAERKRAHARAQRLGTERLTIWLEEFLIARERMHDMPQHGRVALELVLLDLCRPESALSLAEIAERLAALETRVASGVSAPVRMPASAPVRAPVSASASEASPVLPARRETLLASSELPAPTQAAPTTTRDPALVWKRFVDELALHSDTLAQVLRRCARLGEIGERRVSVKVQGLREDERLLLQTPRNQKACAQILSRVLGSEVEFALEDAVQVQRKPKDPFTGTVTELFGGRVEDET